MILVDYRTGSKELKKYLGHLCDIQHLEYGDVAFPGWGESGPSLIGIERKEIGDMVQCMTSGRFVGHQLIGMAEMYDYLYLIVEGIWKAELGTGELLILRGNKWKRIQYGDGSCRKMEAAFLRNHLNTLAVKCGVYVIMTGNMAATGQTILDLYRWWQKPWSQHKSILAVKTQESTTLSRAGIVRRVACQIPGIGWDRSGKAEDRFETVEEMVYATEGNWREIDGVGKITAEKAWLALHTPGKHLP